MLLQFQVVQLTQDKDGPVGAIEAARPAGVRQVQAGEADVVPDGGLSGEGIDTLVGFQVGVVLAQGLQGGVGDSVAVGAILVERQQEERRVGALDNMVIAIAIRSEVKVSCWSGGMADASDLKSEVPLGA